MQLQKYRADKQGEKYENGGTPWYSHWVGGPTLALIRNCKIENRDYGPRTVYVTGEPDTWFSIPAACQYKGRRVVGYITGSEDDTGLVFRADDGY